MQMYKATDFSNREALENQIVSDLGKTTEKKDAKITGTTDELRRLFLSHGQSIWGVEAEASNHENQVPVEKVSRGFIHKSSINQNAKD